jgi:hypothetical protein
VVSTHSTPRPENCAELSNISCLKAQHWEISACAAQRSLDLAVPIVEFGSKVDVLTSLEEASSNFEYASKVEYNL